MVYFERELTQELLLAAQQYPVVTLTGPRQSGKTTLIKHCFPDKAYVNLEAPDLQDLARRDPRAFLGQWPQGVILDEVQHIPELLSYIQVRVDENPSKGQFILTGSHQFALNEAISQSLAGRTAVLHLLPLSLSELTQASQQYEVHQQVLQGFYPRLYQDHLDPTRNYRSYLQTYLERDVRQLLHIKDLSRFQQFLKLCAGRIGQLFNHNSLANELGISSHTVKSWLSILEASYVIFRLPPYHANISKRLVKMPKYYFTDTGLACYLLEINESAQLMRDPLRGALFENMLIMELVKHRLNQGLDPQLYFYRDSQQVEVDVIFKAGNQLTPIEIKMSETFSPDFLKSIAYFKKLFPEQVGEAYLLYRGSFEQEIDQVLLLNYVRNGEIFTPATAGKVTSLPT
jgi:predicted AAA+ superfamily ATPase